MPQAGGVLGIVGIESLRERLRQHRQLRNGPVFGTSESHSAWWRAMDMRLLLRHPFWHQERHRHREHPGLRVGVACPDRRRLPLDLVGDLLGSGPQEVLVPLELLLLRVVEQRELLVRRVVPVRCRWPASVQQDGSMSSASLSARSASFFCRPLVRSFMRASSAWASDGAIRSQSSSRRLLHRLGRLRRSVAAARSLLDLADVQAGEAAFLEHPARRDDLLVQPVAVAADHHQPGVGDHRRGRRGRGRARPGP